MTKGTVVYYENSNIIWHCFIAYYIKSYRHGYTLRLYSMLYRNRCMVCKILCTKNTYYMLHSNFVIWY